MKHRAKLLGLGCLFIVAALVAAVLALVQPSRGTAAAPVPKAHAAGQAGAAGQAVKAAARGAGQRPGPAASEPGPAVATTIAASGGGPGSAVEDVSALVPVQVYNVSGLRTGPVRIGTTTYTDSVRFTCDSGGHDSSGDLDYVVTGYGSLSATLGVPADDTRAVGDTMTVSFFNNGSGAQTSEPVTVSPGHPRRVRLSFRGSSQLEISCSAVSAASQAPEYLELALANATIGPG